MTKLGAITKATTPTTPAPRKNSREALRIKFKRLWLPHFIIAIIAAIAAIPFHAAVVLLKWNSVSETWTDVGIPLLVLAIACLAMFGRIKRYVVEREGESDAWSLLFFSLLTACPFTLVVQRWFAEATERLEVVSAVKELDRPEDFDCVEVPSYVYDLEHPGWSDDIHTSGRRNKSLELDLYIALPLMVDTADTTGAPVAWIVERFHSEIKASALASQKEAAWQALVNETITSIDSGRYDTARYFRNEVRSRYADLFRTAISTSARYDPAAPLRMFSLHPEPFMKAPLRLAPWAVVALIIGSALWFLLLLAYRVRTTLEATVPLRWSLAETWHQVMAWVVPRGDLFVTRILVWMNVIAYLIVAFSGTGFLDLRTSDLLTWGANHGPLTLNGEYWRLLSCIFLHGGFMHLVMNMVGLGVAGVVLEQLLGRSMFAVLYIVCGLAASCASLWWDPTRISVGASGAIFGAYGIVLGLAFFSRVELEGIQVMAFFAALFVIYGLIMGNLSSTTDNAAHLGGLALGLVCGIGLGIRGKFKKTEFDLPE